MSPLRRILVLGVGNIMMRDDGVAAAVLQELERKRLPAGVAILDGGTGGMALTDPIESAEHVILIDSADCGQPPGTVLTFSPDQVRNLQNGQPFSLHQVDLLGVLRFLTELGTCPPVTIIAIQPECVDYGTSLSSPVRAAIPEAVRRVEMEIERIIHA